MCRGLFRVPLSLHTRTRRVSHSRLNQDSSRKQHLAPIMLLPNLNVQQPIFFGPHGGVGQRNADHWPTCLEPSPHEADYVLFFLAGHPSSYPVTKSNCLSAAAWHFSVLFRRAVNCIYRSSVDVVARGRPAPG
ncbi:hypothetical protein TNCV_3347571 [Trichonephila clavipes]|nr:hypothetical protein TNCV_3347571 [Trichonephila clavipes]